MFEWLKQLASHSKALHKRGDALINRDDFSGAVNCYLKVIAHNPGDVKALTHLGFAEIHLGLPTDAITHLSQAIALDSSMYDPYYMLGTLYEQSGALDLAIANFTKAAELAPDFELALLNLGRVLFQTGKLDKARTWLMRGIERNPQCANYHNGLGHVQMTLGEVSEAVTSYSKAIAIDANQLDAHLHLAKAYEKLGQFESAASSYRRVLSIHPHHAAAFYGLGHVEQQLGHIEAAVTCYESAITINPTLPDTFNDLGNVLVQLHRVEQALPCYERALVLQPECAVALGNMGNALNVMNRPLEALAAYERALALDEHIPWIYGAWLHTRMRMCDWRNIDAAFAELGHRIDRGDRVATPFTVLAAPLSVSQLHKCARTYTSDMNFPQASMPTTYLHNRIRIGYFSADFHNHATAHLMAELFERHDRNHFEIFAFSFGPRSMHPTRTRLEAAFDQFIEVASLCDADIAKRARALQIDIAIDLKGFTTNCRTGILAQRAAPVQVSYLGFPCTMGAPFIDYILADTTVIASQHHLAYTEKVAYLPNSYQVNDSQRPISDHVFTRSEVHLPDHGFVFCCFNNTYKITPDVFSVWMRLLQAVPDSVLWLLDDNSYATSHLKAEATTHGIHPDRLVFAPRIEMSEHLARQCLGHLFLDTLYCNAHTTASDALWVGLPVLTCLGHTFAGRVAASLLRSVGLPELVVECLEDYECLAFALATNPDRLAALRQRLQDNRLTSPLFDAALFAKNVEAAYTAMWQRHTTGLTPDHIWI